MMTLSLPSILNIATLVAVLAILVVLWLRFMRKPANRHPMSGEPERNIGARLDRVDAAEKGDPVTPPRNL